MEPKEILEGNRIKLQKPNVTFAVAQELYNLVDSSRDHILPWLDFALTDITKSAEDSYNYLFSLNSEWDSKRKFEYRIYEKESNKMIGGIGAAKRGATQDMHFEIGFWLGKDAISKGYMQEAVKLIEDEFFALGVKRLVIRNAVGNTKSKNIGERLGYQFEGTQKAGGYSKYLDKFLDINVFAKIKNEKNEN